MKYKQVIVCKPSVITDENKTKLENMGVVVIETEEPETIKIIPSNNNNTNQLLQIALESLMISIPDASAVRQRSYFINQIIEKYINTDK